jgi:hypothetical protein
MKSNFVTTLVIAAAVAGSHTSQTLFADYDLIEAEGTMVHGNRFVVRGRKLREEGMSNPEENDEDIEVGSYQNSVVLNGENPLVMAEVVDSQYENCDPEKFLMVFGGIVLVIFALALAVKSAW